MSISAFQEKLFSKGCGSALMIFFAAVMLGYGFSNCSRYGAGDDAAAAAAKANGATVATIGDATIATRQLDEAISQNTQRMQAQMGGAGTTLPLAMQANIAAAAVGQVVNQAASVLVAQQNGARFTDAELIEANREYFVQQVEQAKMQLMMSGKLKPAATAAEIDAALAPMTQGKSVADLKKANDDNFKKAIADKATRSNAMVALSQEILGNALKAKIKPTDQEVTASYDTYVLKRILFAQKSGPAQNPSVRADAVQAELKKGTKFEDLMDKYSDDLPPTKKKVRDNELTVPVNMLDSQPEYKGMKGQAPGFVTGLIDVPQGKAIYKLIQVRNDLPKDFATNKARYIAEYTQRKVQEETQKQLAALTASDAVKWQSAGYHALYMLTQSPAAGASPDSKMTAVLQAAEEALKKPEPSDVRPATLALYGASTALYNQATDKTKLVDSRIGVLNTVLKSIDDFDIRMELVDLYAQKKDSAATLTNLLAAAKTNAMYDATGQRHFGDIAAKMVKLKADGLVTDAQLADVVAAQANWRTSKEATDKAAAEAKVQEEEVRRQNEAELERQRAETAKKTPPATTPSTAPAAGGKAPATSTTNTFTGTKKP